MSNLDIDTVEEALKRLRKLSGSFKRGGLMTDYTLAQKALEALERIKQPRLM